jgi:hypothetical protein
VGAPITEATAVTSKGPSIQGIGVRNHRQSCTASHAANKVNTTRVR